MKLCGARCWSVLRARFQRRAAWSQRRRFGTVAALLAPARPKKAGVGGTGIEMPPGVLQNRASMSIHLSSRRTRSLSVALRVATRRRRRRAHSLSALARASLRLAKSQLPRSRRAPHTAKMPRAKQKKASCSLTEVVFVLVLLACGFMIGFVGSHTSSEEDAPVRLRQHPAIPPRHIAEQHSSGPLNASMWGHIPQPLRAAQSAARHPRLSKTAPIADIIRTGTPTRASGLHHTCTSPCAASTMLPT